MAVAPDATGVAGGAPARDMGATATWRPVVEAAGIAARQAPEQQIIAGSKT